jgi:hypothetical protein
MRPTIVRPDGLSAHAVNATRSTPASLQQARAACALHYLTKPLNLAGFLALLEQIDTRFGNLPGA